MSPIVRFLRQQGGFCTRAEALQATSRAEVDHALVTGEIVWLARGRYGLPDLGLSVATAHGMRAVLSHASAALWHGWEVKEVPVKTHVTLPYRRHVGASAPTVHIHRADLGPDDVVDRICTSVDRTLLDCARVLPFDEGLAIADSAVRHGVDQAVLHRVAMTARGRGRPQVVAVMRSADGRAANPFESVLRAIALDIPGLHVRPQRLIVGSSQIVRPDLVDERLRVVIEADSFEWHGGRADLARDARRYNLLVVDGWIVLRFSYEDVMFRPDYVRGVLEGVVRLVDARTQVAG